MSQPAQPNDERVTVAGLEGETPLAGYFRDADHASDSPLAWQIDPKSAHIDALRGLFHGPAGLVRLRLWVFITLMGQGEASLTREELDQLFHAIRPEALDTVLKRFRDVGLLTPGTRPSAATASRRWPNRWPPCSARRTAVGATMNLPACWGRS